MNNKGITQEALFGAVMAFVLLGVATVFVLFVGQAAAIIACVVVAIVFSLGFRAWRRRHPSEGD